jgi:hypothetical protein
MQLQGRLRSGVTLRLSVLGRTSTNYARTDRWRLCASFGRIQQGCYRYLPTAACIAPVSQFTCYYAFPPAQSLKLWEKDCKAWGGRSTRMRAWTAFVTPGWIWWSEQLLLQYPCLRTHYGSCLAGVCGRVVAHCTRTTTPVRLSYSCFRTIRNRQGVKQAVWYTAMEWPWITCQKPWWCFLLMVNTYSRLAPALLQESESQFTCYSAFQLKLWETMHMFTLHYMQYMRRYKHVPAWTKEYSVRYEFMPTWLGAWRRVVTLGWCGYLPQRLRTQIQLGDLWSTMWESTLYMYYSCRIICRFIRTIWQSSRDWASVVYTARDFLHHLPKGHDDAFFLHVVNLHNELVLKQVSLSQNIQW